MSTFLFDDIVFGPIKSRRLGVSLGVNLLPVNKKVCNFDCVYCECGWNSNNASVTPKLPKANEIIDRLTEVLFDMKEKSELPDVITFAGNGEPTIHPEFPSIIDRVIELRNNIAPQVKVSVLSNATLIHKPEIANALKKIDQNILKLDSGFIETIRLINQPNASFNFEELTKYLSQFKNLTIQTLFLKGLVNDKAFDNTTDKEIEEWIKILQKIKPVQVMIYSIARDTPLDSLQKVDTIVLNEIAKKIKKLGIDVLVTA